MAQGRTLVLLYALSPNLLFVTSNRPSIVQIDLGTVSIIAGVQIVAVSNLTSSGEGRIDN